MSHLVDVTVDLFQNAQHNVFIDSGWNTENFAMDAETGSISGRVYEDFDQDDVYDPLEEIENATVRAWLTPTPSFSISVFTEADGMYLMPLVPVPIITGSYTVHAEQVSGTPRYEPNEVDNVYVNPGVTTTDVDITLMREHGDVSGTVTYDGVNPLYGATVKFFFHWYSTYVEIFDTTTDVNGFYMFDTEDTITVNNELDPGEDVDMDGMLDELWEGQWTIEVSHPAFTTKTKDIIVASSYTVDFDFDIPGDLLPETAKIEGTVTDPAPISGALITADRGDIQVQAVSGLGGAYEMWVPWGMYGTITCEAATYPTITMGPYNIMDYGGSPPAGFSDLDLDLEVDDLTLDFDYSGIVILISPANLATLTSLNVTFTWNAFPGATTYTIQADDTSDCSSPIYTNSISDPTTTDSYTFSTYGTYYWRVTADNSNWSAIWSFTISVTGVGPELVYPDNGITITDQTPTFDWDPFSGASTYTIEVDDTPDFSSPELTDSISHPTTDYTPGSPLPDDTGYWWRVKANNSDWSVVWYFYVDTDAGSVSGMVTHSGGTPLGDVIVLAYIIEDWDKIEKVGETISDINGIFTLSSLPSGVAMDIAFYKQGYKADSLNITLSAGEVLTGQTIDLEAGTT
ncbi:MAG: hypothetical protein KAV48_04990, partial [Methanomicrobia archaeon]|nr:hypothetical protein [Methanomicrobia archaeon]